MKIIPCKNYIPCKTYMIVHDDGMNKRVNDISALLYAGKLFIWFVDAINYAIMSNPRAYELKSLLPQIESLRDQLTSILNSYSNPPKKKPVLKIVKTEDP